MLKDNLGESVIGREIRLGTVAHTVVGVMPPGYGFPMNHRFWTPFRVDPAGRGYDWVTWRETDGLITAAYVFHRDRGTAGLQGPGCGAGR